MGLWPGIAGITFVLAPITCMATSSLARTEAAGDASRGGVPAEPHSVSPAETETKMS